MARRGWSAGVVSTLSGAAVLLGWATAAGADGRALPRPGPAALALQDGFGVQYWGQGYTAEVLARAPHGLLILEAAKAMSGDRGRSTERFFTRKEMQRITRDGTRPVLAYLNLAEIETYRDYWRHVGQAGGDPKHAAQERWIGPRSAQAEQLALYWTPEWEAILMDRVDRLMALGVDGLFLDDVLHYYTFATGAGLTWTGVDRGGAPADAPAHARAMMGLVDRLAARARAAACDAIIIVNNGVYIGRDAGPDGAEDFARYLSAIDGILVETVFGSDSRGQVIEVLTSDFAHRGKAVLALDFAGAGPDLPPKALRARLSVRAAETGFSVYLAPDGRFDRLAAPITAQARDRQAQ